MNVPHIVNRGAEWYASIGTEQSTRTKVVSVSGHVQRPGNYEIGSASLAEIICGLAGGPGEEARGPGVVSRRLVGPGLTGDDLQPCPHLRGDGRAGSMLGSGAIIVGDDTVSVPELALRTARFYHHESCGKCTCRRAPTGP